LTGGISSLRKHINQYSISLFLLVVYILFDATRNWDTHRKTYKTKCEERREEEIHKRGTGEKCAATQREKLVVQKNWQW